MKYKAVFAFMIVSFFFQRELCCQSINEDLINKGIVEIYMMNNNNATDRKTCIGFIVGFDLDNYYIVTANHNRDKVGKDRIENYYDSFSIRFFQDTKTYIVKHVNHDEIMDLLLLSIERKEVKSIDIGDLLDIIEKPLVARESLYAKSYMNETAWYPALNGEFSKYYFNDIEFTDMVVEEGFSGGPLLNEKLEVAGMILKGGTPNKALKIEAIIVNIENKFIIKLLKNYDDDKTLLLVDKKKVKANGVDSATIKLFPKDKNGLLLGSHQDIFFIVSEPAYKDGADKYDPEKKYYYQEVRSNKKGTSTVTVSINGRLLKKNKYPKIKFVQDRDWKGFLRKSGIVSLIGGGLGYWWFQKNTIKKKDEYYNSEDRANKYKYDDKINEIKLQKNLRTASVVISAAGFSLAFISFTVNF